MKFANATKLYRKSGVAQWRSAVPVSSSQIIRPTSNAPFVILTEAKRSGSAVPVSPPEIIRSTSNAPFVIPTAAQRSGGICSFVSLSQITRPSTNPPFVISCRAAVDRATCAAFRKESRMKLAEPTNFNRESGGAQWRDLQFRSLTFVLRSKQLALRVLGNCLENYLAIFLRVHFSPNLGNRPVRCDKESIALIEFHIFEGHQRDTIGSGGLAL